MKLSWQRTGSTCTGMTSAVLFVLLATPAGAEIYRCSDGETTVFSDLPCAQAAEVYTAKRRVSVVNAADNLDEVVASNKAFLERRREALAQQRERAARERREAQQRQRRLEAREAAPRYRTVVGHLGNSRLGNAGTPLVDARTRARQRGSDSDEERSQRRTLLSRSGGNQRNILR